MPEDPQTDGGTGAVVTPEDTDDSEAPTRQTASDASEFQGDDLVIGYPSAEQPVIDGESIQVPPGKVTALVGPNGSGKSTLLKGLADQQAIDRAIDLAGVDHLRGREVGSLSGGQQQLVWIAMVLAQETDVLLLDEPTTFLDMHHQLEVMEIVESLRDESNITVVLVLHDIDQAARYADHMIALKDSSIYARGEPENVVTEQLLADVFEVEATVVDTEWGPEIKPVAPLHEETAAE